MKLNFLSVLIITQIFFACGGDHIEKGDSSKKRTGTSQIEKAPFNRQSNAPISLDSGSPGGRSDKRPTQPHPDTSNTKKVKRTIFVPEEVKGKWKSVKLLVKEKTEGGYEEVKTLSMGDEFDIPNSKIHVKVGTFLPHMSIGESAFTSLSNQPINPAVNLTITENGKELYNGWAYSKFPKLYNFNHERFSVILQDYVPSD